MPPLSGLVRAIVYRAGQQPQPWVEKILPGPETSINGPNHLRPTPDR